MVYGTYDGPGIHPDQNAGHPNATQATGKAGFSYTNLAAGVVSLALIAGVGMWGYELLMRDVTGIPVVRAVQGETRVRPEEPGGMIASHQGLSVNAVAADGSAAGPVEQVILAPQPVRLTPEDVPVDPNAVALMQQNVARLTAPEEGSLTVFVDQAQVDRAVETGSVDDLVAALTADVAPLSPSAEDKDPKVIVQTGTPTAALLVEPATTALAAVPGIRQSLRPRLRPASLRRAPAAVVQPAVATPAVATSGPRDLDAASLPVGTRLVQLGAYDSAAVAKREWERFNRRFGAVMANKDRVIQKATSGGKTFYRLRVHGFADLSQARQFCSVLTAQNSDCIPVVTR